MSGLSGPARASQVPLLFFPTMSSLIPRRCRITVSSLFSVCSLDFAHEIGAHPPQHYLRGYRCVHITLRPGCLRCTLSGYVVESLSIKPFPTSCRLLATWLPESRHGLDLEQSALAPHPTRSGTVYLGAHLRYNIFIVCVNADVPPETPFASILQKYTPLATVSPLSETPRHSTE